VRFLRTTAILSAFAFLLFNLIELEAAAQFISGRLVFEDYNFTCDQQCVVSLLISGVRPIQTVVADLGGHFTFSNVPRGPLAIRVEIDGFEVANVRVQDFDIGGEMMITVPAIRRPLPLRPGRPVVNISDFLERYPKKAVSFYEKGSASLKNKKTDEAVKYLRNAVELAPTFSEAHNQLGLAYMQAGQKDDAESEFIKAHELNSAAVSPLVNLSRLYLDENDLDRALTASEQAVKADSHSPLAFFSLGVALYKAAQFDRAEVALNRALELGPKVGAIRLMLANVYLKLQAYDKSLEQLSKYIFENPEGQQLEEAKAMRDRLLQARAAGQPQ
jgi:predicted Zn-dependent protease